MAVYVVDSNFFIQAHRYTYPLDVAMSYWNKVKDLAQQGTIISIDKVKNELFGNNDALKTWCLSNLPKDFFKNSEEAIAEYGRVSAWAISRAQHYLPNALNEFLDADEADAFLVAYALADPSNRIIVTQEVSDPNRKNKIKIPEPCIAFGVQYLNAMEMFRRLGETF